MTDQQDTLVMIDRGGPGTVEDILPWDHLLLEVPMGLILHPGEVEALMPMGLELVEVMGASKEVVEAIEAAKYSLTMTIGSSYKDWQQMQQRKI